MSQSLQERESAILETRREFQKELEILRDIVAIQKKIHCLVSLNPFGEGKKPSVNVPKVNINIEQFFTAWNVGYNMKGGGKTLITKLFEIPLLKKTGKGAYTLSLNPYP